MSITDIKNMPLLERVRLMEEIWDTLNHEIPEIGSPSWHEDVLQERKESIKNGNVKLYTIAELKAMRR